MSHLPWPTPSCVRRVVELFDGDLRRLDRRLATRARSGPRRTPFNSSPNVWGYVLELIADDGGVEVDQHGEPWPDALARVARRAVWSEERIRGGFEFLRANHLVRWQAPSPDVLVARIDEDRLVAFLRSGTREGCSHTLTYFRGRALYRRAAWLDRVLERTGHTGAA